MKLADIASELDVEDIPDLLEMLREEGAGTIDQIIVENSAFAAEVGDQGRITIPSAERRKLGIEKGDLVQVLVRKIKPKDKE